MGPDRHGGQGKAAGTRATEAHSGPWRRRYLAGDSAPALPFIRARPDQGEDHLAGRDRDLPIVEVEEARGRVPSTPHLKPSASSKGRSPARPGRSPTRWCASTGRPGIGTGRDRFWFGKGKTKTISVKLNTKGLGYLEDAGSSTSR